MKANPVLGYRLLFDDNPLPMWVFDEETLNFIAVNDAALRQYGYSLEEFLSIGLRDIRPEEDVPGLLGELRSSPSKVTDSSEWRHRRKDGSVFDVEVTWHRLEIGGRPARLTVVNDITDRKAAQAVLLESEERYRSVVNAMGEGLVLRDAEGIIRAFNPRAEQILGFTVEQMMGRTSIMPGWTTIHEDGSPFLEDTHPTVVTLRTGDACSNVVMGVRKPSGELTWILINSHPIFSQGGSKPAAAVATFTDITQLKLTEERLRRSADRLETLHEIDIAILSATDPAGLSTAALKRIRQHVSCERATVLLFDPKTARGRFLAVDQDGDLGPAAGEELPASAVQAILALGRESTYYVEDLHKVPDRLPFLEELSSRGIRSTIAAPMWTGGELIGGLFLSSVEPSRFETEDRDVAAEVAAQLAIAIEQARLRKESADRASELERLVADLRRTDDMRRQLLVRLSTAQEEERQRIAVDIHDDTIQKLTALGLRLETLQGKLDGQHSGALDELRRTTEVSIERLRNLMFELSPPALERDGLAVTLRNYIAHTFGDGLDWQVDNQLEIEPSKEVRTIAYRIALEALTNVRKHARATRLELLLKEEIGGILVRIDDNGVGIPRESLSEVRPGHLGLMSMQERAEWAGGWSRIQRIAGGGTRVELWLPSAEGELATHLEAAHWEKAAR